MHRRRPLSVSATRFGARAIPVALTVVLFAACGSGTPGELGGQRAESPPPPAAAGVSPLPVGPVLLPAVQEPTTEVAEVERQPIEEPERPAVGEGQFMGALKFQRRSNFGNADGLIVHRLNSGIWVVDTNEQFVDTNPLLDYGPVYDQTSEPPGAVGGTAVIAMHNVTKSPPELTAVTVNGVTHRESRMMLSQYNEQQMAIPDPARRRYQNNVSPGDTFEVILNNPNGTITVLTYEVTEARNVDPVGPSFASLQDPPAERNGSRLVVYYCWEPGSDTFRQAAVATLTSRETRPGSVPDPGPQPRRATAIH